MRRKFILTAFSFRPSLSLSLFLSFSLFLPRATPGNHQAVRTTLITCQNRTLFCCTVHTRSLWWLTTSPFMSSYVWQSSKVNCDSWVSFLRVFNFCAFFFHVILPISYLYIKHERFCCPWLACAELLRWILFDPTVRDRSAKKR